MLSQTNAKIAGGGVTEIKEDVLLNNSEVTCSYSDMYCTKYLKIDDNNFVGASSTNPGGGSNSLFIQNGFFANSQRVSTISNFSFGQSYTSSIAIRPGSMMSPNKDFMILSGVNSNTNIFAIPLTKSGDNYLLGTPISFDLGVTSGSDGFSLHCFIDNNTFAYFYSSAIHIFQFQNNEITELKSISLANTPQNIKFYDGKFVIVYSGYDTVVDLLDYETETVVKTYTATSKSLQKYCLIYKNYCLLLSAYIDSNYILLNLDTFTEIMLTKPSSVWTITPPFFDEDFYELEDNKIIIAPNTYPATTDQQYYAFIFDFTNNTMLNIAVIPNTSTYYAQYSFYISFYYIKDFLMCYTMFQGNVRGHCYEISKDFVISIVYNGWVYTATDKASS